MDTLIRTATDFLSVITVVEINGTWSYLVYLYLVSKTLSESLEPHGLSYLQIPLIKLGKT